MRRLLPILLALCSLCVVVPQAFAAGVLRGLVLSAENNQPLAAVRVQLQGARLGALTDANGRFVITDVPAGVYNVEFSVLGRKRETRFEVAVTPGRPVSLEVSLEEEVVAGDSVTVTASPFRRPAESPVSVQNIGAAEIERFPGGNRDISRVIQSLPGVASAATYRNDVLVRGGAPNENRFFLDGVEVPVINHFATQGSSGGPVGMIDVNFVQDVDLFTGAFPAARGNALSSVMEFHMKDGNDERLARSLTAGASDFGVTLDGPVNATNRVIFSARRSYLQYLASAIGLPFLPTYNDAQLRWHWHPNARDQVTLLAIGAIDQFELNTDANETEFQRWVLDNLPETPQWNYTTGVTWKRLGTSSVRTLVVSRSQLDNRAKKYFRNDETSESNLLLDYRSTETQDRARAEWTRRAGPWRWTWGAGGDHHVYTNSTFQKTVTPAQVLTVDFDSRLSLTTGAAFAQVTRAFDAERFTASFGLRTDAADYSSRTRNPLDPLSPRLSGTWQAKPALRVSASAARYQLPPYGARLSRRRRGARQPFVRRRVDPGRPSRRGRRMVDEDELAADRRGVLQALLALSVPHARLDLARQPRRRLRRDRQRAGRCALARPRLGLRAARAAAAAPWLVRHRRVHVRAQRVHERRRRLPSRVVGQPPRGLRRGRQALRPRLGSRRPLAAARRRAVHAGRRLALLAARSVGRDRPRRARHPAHQLRARRRAAPARPARRQDLAVPQRQPAALPRRAERVRLRGRTRPHALRGAGRRRTAARESGRLLALPREDARARIRHAAADDRIALVVLRALDAREVTLYAGAAGGAGADFSVCGSGVAPPACGP
ncbi:MAG: TonB-dependent receptor [Candidatus Eisenbacteria bacterium]|nr:TonB-dependent receptor [Candidatus Eisenbacteria bacterium]